MRRTPEYLLVAGNGSGFRRKPDNREDSLTF